MGVAADAQAQPGPFPQWCPGEYWDPGWGNNWDWNGTATTGVADHAAVRGPGWDHDHDRPAARRLGPRPPPAGPWGPPHQPGDHCLSLRNQTRPAGTFGGARLLSAISVASVRVTPERGVDLVAERDAARVRVGLGGVETIRHVRVADPVLEVDEPE